MGESRLCRFLVNGFWSFWVVVWAVAMTASAFGQPPLTITEAGYFITTLDAEGKPVYTELTTVIDLTGGNAPSPPGDEPKFDMELVKLSQEWAKEVGDPKSAQALAAIYSQVRAALEDEVLSKGNIWPTLGKATDKGLAVVDSVEKWKPFRAKLTALMTERSQRGTLSTPQQINTLLLSVQQGLEQSADGSDALGVDVLVQIAKCVNEVIDETK